MKTVIIDGFEMAELLHAALAMVDEMFRFSTETWGENPTAEKTNKKATVDLEKFFAEFDFQREKMWQENGCPESMQWFSAKDLAGLPGMPKTESGVRRKAKREGWIRRERPRQ